MDLVAIHTHLEARRHAASLPVRLYALADALLLASSRDAPALVRSPANVALFDGTADAALADAGPWLIDVDGTSETLRDALLHQAASSNGISWLISAYDITSLGREMQQRLDARLPNGNIVLLRFYDARAMASIASMLTFSQRLSFFQPTFDWFTQIDSQLTRIHPHA